LENDTQLPVVASTAASLWWVMQTLGIKAAVPGFGRLLA
jgi:maleate cis-trans isomerase